MADTSSITTLHTASWGISPNHRSSVVTGVVVSWDETAEFTIAEEQNEVGSRIGMTVYDKRYSVNCVVQVAANTPAPSPGAYIEVTPADATSGTRKYFVRNARVSESNSSYRRITISLEASEYSSQGNHINGADGISVSST